MLYHDILSAGQRKIFTKNLFTGILKQKLFDTVTYKMVESGDISFQLCESGEGDVALGEARINTIANNPDDPLYQYMIPDVPSKHSYQFHFNYNKNKEDGTPDTNWNNAIANEAFRKTWYHGLDLTITLNVPTQLTQWFVKNNFYTMKGLLCYTSDGTDYVELVRKELGLAEEMVKHQFDLMLKKQLNTKTGNGRTVCCCCNLPG